MGGGGLCVRCGRWDGIGRRGVGEEEGKGSVRMKRT